MNRSSITPKPVLPRILLWLVLLFGVAGTAYAQQNLFNIPSGDITPRSKFFYQHQLNFYSLKNLESKAHLVYGLGKGWDAGVNLVDMPIRIMSDSSLFGFNDSRSRNPLYPLLMATLQKQFILHDDWLLNVGTQAGPNLARNGGNLAVAHFTYATLRWHPFKKGYVIGGPYYSNDVYTGGEEHTVGWMIGYELPLTDDFSLMGDLISGQHKKSVSTFGGVYNIGERVQICVAALLPFPNQNLDRGVVVELNLFGWDFQEGH